MSAECTVVEGSPLGSALKWDKLASYLKRKLVKEGNEYIGPLETLVDFFEKESVIIITIKGAEPDGTPYYIKCTKIEGG